MNSNINTTPCSKQRFIQNLAESSLFRLHQDAFHALTNLDLSLVSAKESEHDVLDPITVREGGLAITRVPVKIGKNAIAFMQTGAVRLIPPGDAAFHEVARDMLASVHHFCKAFKKATGLTFTDFVNHARVEKARRLLMRPSTRITEVAYDVGFQSLSHFNRSFRRITSESPTEFRSRLKNGSMEEHTAMAA